MTDAALIKAAMQAAERKSLSVSDSQLLQIAAMAHGGDLPLTQHERDRLESLLEDDD